MVCTPQCPFGWRADCVPDAIIIRGDYERYSHYSGVVTDIIREQVPLYEKSSIDEFYIDLSGMDRFYGCYSFATELRQKIMKETHLPISFGLSKNKTVSKIATGEAKPNGQMKIDLGTEIPFLAPLPVRKIPGAGEKTCTLLRSMGCRESAYITRDAGEVVRESIGRAWYFALEKSQWHRQ
jgi:DNA polymerase-4